MKVLTFVVPAYNSEAFLDKGIPSMLHPQVLEKLEVIIVNDGSQDATADVARKYCEMYPQTVRLISQENKGHGGALNTGCAAATGKYLKVVDSDDWVETDNLPRLVELLETAESDVVLCHYRTYDISSGEVRDWKCDPPAFGENYSMESIVENWRSFYHLMTFHGILYRRDFYQKLGIRLSEHVFYEDYEFATFPCCHAAGIMPVDLFLYDYRIGDVNQSVSDASKLKRIGHMETVLDRMIRQSNLSQDGQGYTAIKTQELLLSYLTIVLLANPDKRGGRSMAKKMMEKFQREFPAAYGLAQKKYKVFCLLNRLHISNTAWKRFLESKLYRKLRGNGV